MASFRRLRLLVDYKGGDSYIWIIFSAVGVKYDRFEEIQVGED